MKRLFLASLVIFACGASWRAGAFLSAEALGAKAAAPAMRADAKVSALQNEARFAMPFAGLQWRSIGPIRGGRSIASAGSPSRPFEYYFGATGGGLWKTTDGGTTWTPITDRQIASSSVGAIAVAPSRPDTVYIGMGESELRGNIIQGDGVYKSTDAGKTWRHVGLADTLTISRLRVHPGNPDLIYAAALGDPTQASEARGVYRSRDGGATWQKILYRDDKTGAVDLVIDPSNPNALYAALWQVTRVPWQLSSGGPGSGLFKSTDAGDTWTEITRANGMPAGVIGKIGITVSGADARRLYAVIEAAAGGLYKSDDAGASWTLANPHRDLWQRAFYFNRIVADPRDIDTVYILNFSFLKSSDAGATYHVIPSAHADYHDLWIDPANTARMILSDDGGASVSVNGGATWTSQAYATAQLYRVETTADFPYHVVACQQDNTSIAVPSTREGSMHLPGQPVGADYYEVGGGESGWVAPHPAKPDLIFAGSTNVLTRFDRRTGEERDVQPWPRTVMGEPARDMPERWNWTYPVIFSPIPPYDLYAGSQHVWRSRDEGATWQRISDDLTRADPKTLGDSGGPIMLDQDGPEVYGTVVIIAPSRRERDTVWSGSDDGLVQVTRNGGTRWTNVTPPDLPAFARITSIDPSAHAPGRAYLSARRNQLGERRPFVYRTDDYGATWTRIESGIDTHDFVHVVREDPVKAGLLYAGTEHGIYVSFDAGRRWQSLRLNLPDVQVPDIKVERDDLVIATHGRSFYVLDRIAPLRQWEPALTTKATHLFAPTGVYRRVFPAKIDVLIARAPAAASLEILDGAGNVVREIAAPKPLRPGHHRFEWNLRTRGATVFPGMILEAANPAAGVLVPPGDYQVRFTADGAAQTQKFTVQADPRISGVSAADYRAQYELALQVRDATAAANDAVVKIRRMKAELAGAATSPPDLLDRLSAIEASLYQVKNQSSKDKIAFPIKLNDRLAGLLTLVQTGDGAPSAPQRAVARELMAELNAQLARLTQLAPK
jgi:photosystem II stability/assembly factor-like uncharacterized protein